MGSGKRSGRRITVNQLARVFACLLLCSGAAAACREDTVSLQGEWGFARFRVEVADSDDSRALGLMHRTEMSAGSGMLFVYPSQQYVTFWMKNTLIPLDLLFIDSRGSLVQVHSNARPQDLTTIPSVTPVQYVLEINAGLAQAMGIVAGSQIQHPSIASNLAIWPCE